MGYGLNAYPAEKERRPQKQEAPPPFIFLSQSLTRWIEMTVAFETGKAVYGLGGTVESVERGPEASRSKRPSISHYRSVVIEEATKAGVCHQDALSGKRYNGICYARFRAWRRLRDMGYSLPGIGAVSGKHHTSILHGIRQINEMEPRNAATD